MNLAVNYSPQAADLFREKKIRFDLFKCPDWDDLIADARAVMPVYVHFPLVTGQIKDADLARVENLLEDTLTPYVNVHLHATTDDFPDMALNSQNSNDAMQITEWLIKEVEHLTRHFGAERIIAENLIYRGFGMKTVRPVVLPEVISDVLEYTGCGFLLDVSHARIAAYHLGVEAPTDMWDYLNRLPVEHLTELHLTGIKFHNETVMDHFGCSKTDWEVLEKVFSNIRKGKWAEPETVSFEYGGIGKPFAWRSKTEVLANDVPRLWGLVRASEKTAQAVA